MISSQQCAIRNRQGIQILEAVLLMPLLLLGTFSFFVLGPAITVQQTLNSAAAETAREVAKRVPTQSAATIASATLEPILAVHGLTLDPQSGVLVVIEEDDNQVTCLGNTSIGPCPATSSITSEDRVKVTVIVNIKGTPIPNALGAVGLDLSSKQIICTATAFRDS